MIPPHEFKVMRLRECVSPADVVDTPELCAKYWRDNIPQSSWFDPMKEALVVLVLNTRFRVMGHNLVALGDVCSVYAHPREVLRPVIIAAGHSFVLMHNHPTGDPTPSENDIRMTRDMARGGQIFKIELLDHVIMGADSHSSLKSLGYLPL